MTPQPHASPQSSSTNRSYPVYTGLPPGSSAAPRSVELPTPSTDLLKLLAGDPTLCAQRPRANVAERPADPHLLRVIEAWPALPEGIRAAVLAVIDRTTAARKL